VGIHVQEIERGERGLHARPNPPPAPVMMTFFPSNRSYGCQRDPKWVQRVRSEMRGERGRDESAIKLLLEHDKLQETPQYRPPSLH